MTPRDTHTAVCIDSLCGSVWSTERFDKLAILRHECFLLADSIKPLCGRHASGGTWFRVASGAANSTRNVERMIAALLYQWDSTCLRFGQAIAIAVSWQQIVLLGSFIRCCNLSSLTRIYDFDAKIQFSIKSLYGKDSPHFQVVVK